MQILACWGSPYPKPPLPLHCDLGEALHCITPDNVQNTVKKPLDQGGSEHSPCSETLYTCPYLSSPPIQTIPPFEACLLQPSPLTSHGYFIFPPLCSCHAVPSTPTSLPTFLGPVKVSNVQVIHCIAVWGTGLLRENDKKIGSRSNDSMVPFQSSSPDFNDEGSQ